MPALWPLLRSILFTLDAEKAHHLCLHFLESVPKDLLDQVFRKITVSEKLKTEFLGMTFQHPIGLAAGFDKNARFIHYLENFAFSFVELGTVTPKAQVGNEKPRLFRVPEKKSLFNRMGFNNDGAEKIAERLKIFKSKNPESFLKIGVNLGKNKVTELEKSHLDYSLAAKSFRGLADFLIVNVSSPNTPGLRKLQGIEPLRKILYEVHNENEKWTKKVPILLKLAPELSDQELNDILQCEEELAIDAWVLTNTLAGKHQNLNGGFSGEVLKEDALKALKYISKHSQKKVVSVGGISKAEDVLDRQSFGASLVEIYTAWVYNGPMFVKKILKKMESTL